MEGKKMTNNKVPTKYIDTEMATDEELGQAMSTKQDLLGFTPENISNKNQPDGYAGLGPDGIIPASILPPGNGGTATEVTAHIQSTSNPHETTKEQIGLGNVQNLDQTDPTNIVQSSSHRFVSDSEKSSWNEKLGDGSSITIIDPSSIGEIRLFAGPIDAENFLEPNGSSVLRSQYPELFAAIGTTYGAVDGNSFNLPDYRGVFFRGMDNGRGLDLGRTLGSYQADEFGSHRHIGGYAGVNANASYGVTTAPNGNINSQSGQSVNNHPWTSTSGGTETRPKNVAVNVGIRFKARTLIVQI
jgi:microcystin-dependent protein